MIYTTARYADASGALVIGTDANGNSETVPLDHALFRQPDDGPVGFVANGGIIQPYTAPEPGPYRLYKSTFIRRMKKDKDGDEAAIMEQVLASADAQLRLLFNSVEYFVSDDPLFYALTLAVGAAVGEKRAKELLAED